MAESEKIPLRERFIDSIADFIYVIVRSVQSIASNDVSILASGLVYSTLVAAIPCLTFFITFMSLFGVVNSFIELFSAFLSEIFGHEIGTSVSSMMTQYTSNAMGLGIFGLFSFVISSLFLISKIYKVINSIFCCKESTGPVRRFGSFFIFLLFTAVIISVSLVLSSYANAMLANVSGELASVPLPVRFFKKNGGYLISLICLFCLFYYVPNVKIRFRSALLGSVVGTVFLYIATYLFKRIVLGLVSYSVIYGSLAVIFFIFLYLYASWCIILMAAELTYVHQFRPDSSQVQGLSTSPEQQLSDCVNLLAIIGENFRRGNGPIDQKHIIKMFPLSPKVLSFYLGLFVQRGFILEMFGRGRRHISYIPARPLSTILVKDIVEISFRQNSEAEASMGREIAEGLLSYTESAYDSATLEDLLEGRDAY